MTGLVAPPPNADPADAVITADGWYPEVALLELRNALRIGDGAVTTERLTVAVEGAIVSAIRALAGWRATREAEGATELSWVTDLEINGQNYAELLWLRIVRNLAAAEIGDLHRDITATDQGLDRAEEKAETADDYRRLAWTAIADLRSIGGEPVPRNRVTLI
jgi:hypothetical protein